MDVQFKCDDAFPNLKCVPEPFFLEKAPYTCIIIIRLYVLCIFRKWSW